MRMPEHISPMLATLVEEPFDHKEWLFETKWDGYRALAFVKKDTIKLMSRTRHSWNALFPEFVEDLKKSTQEVILDGEIVVLDEEGKSHFQLLQNFQKNRTGHLYYYVFDILYREGKDLRERPLIERKKILKQYLSKSSFSLVRFSDYIIGKGTSFFQQAKLAHLEGIIGKKMSSSYRSKRSCDWVKIKTSLQQEVVIGGYTKPRGGRQHFGSLLVGVYNDKKELIYTGHVGGGFNTELLQQVYDRLKPLIQSKCPFQDMPKGNMPVTWVSPKLICEVSFAEWTHDNQMRQPIFHGLRIDKKPYQVKNEIFINISKGENLEKKAKNTSMFSNEAKIYWPDEKYTKGDLLDYYKKVSRFILPYLKNRPIMLHRYPEGIYGLNFYQKDINFAIPEWLKVYPVKHEGSTVRYMGINSVRSLLYAVNLGSIDLHPFLSTYAHLENPDFCLIDLDPEDISFSKVVETALVIHEILKSLGVKHFCKTSGGRGLHILIPLHRKYDYEQSRQLAEIIAHLAHQQLPKITSLERSPKKREKKVYLDCLQNRFGQTMAAPYSVRPRPKAPVSTPLLWSEVNTHLDPESFNIESIPQRLEEMGDLLKPVLGAGIDIKKILKTVSKTFC